MSLVILILKDPKSIRNSLEVLIERRLLGREEDRVYELFSINSGNMVLIPMNRNSLYIN